LFFTNCREKRCNGTFNLETVFPRSAEWHITRKTSINAQRNSLISNRKSQASFVKPSLSLFYSMFPYYPHTTNTISCAYIMRSDKKINESKAISSKDIIVLLHKNK